MATKTLPKQTPWAEQTDDAGAWGLAWIDQYEAWRIVDDVYEGTLRMRACGERYLPRFPKELDTAEEPHYSNRLAVAYLHNATRRAIHGYTGLVFRVDPTLEDVPSQIEPMLENVDLTGRGFPVFVKDVFRRKVKDGHGHIFVDWHGDKNERGQDTEDARPYCTHIRKDQVIRFETERRGGRIVLVSFAYQDSETRKAGDFTQKRVDVVRQYDLVPVAEHMDARGAGNDATDGEQVLLRVWTREADTEGEWETDEEVGPEGRLMGPRMPRIPLVTDYAERTGFMTSDPPLLDVALLNVCHYQQWSDRRSALHAGAHEPIVGTGVDKNEFEAISIGPNVGFRFSNPEAKVFRVGVSGVSYEASMNELQMIVEMISSMTLSVLMERQRDMTATENRGQKAEQDSDLAAMARATGDAFEEVLQLMAMWLADPNATGGTVDPESAGSVKVNTDFQVQELNPQLAESIRTANEKGQISDETFWKAWMKSEILPPDFDMDLERDRLANAGMGELAAMVQQMREDREGGDPPPEDEPDDGGEA